MAASSIGLSLSWVILTRSRGAEYPPVLNEWLLALPDRPFFKNKVHTTLHLAFDRVFGHAKALGNLLLRESVDFTHDENLAAPLGQTVHERLQFLQFLL